MPEGSSRCVEVHRAALMIDARAYYCAFVQAARRARKSILLSGWQFDTQAVLLRGEDELSDLPCQFLPFLNQLTEQNPELVIHVVAWDYSLVYAVEREWLQGLKASFGSNERLHFEYFTHPNRGGSHHQKYAIIDEEIAFVGGLDICDSRWDDRDHVPHRKERIDTDGRPYRPFHDIQLAVTGPIVREMRGLFTALLEDSTKRFVVPPLDCPSEGTAEDVLALGMPLRTRQALLSRTIYKSEDDVVTEVLQLLVHAISQAERLIYVENQYFTSSELLVQLVRRLSDPSRPSLDLVFVMPDGADTPKEDFVLGDRQRAVRYALNRVAQERGHRLRFFYSRDGSDPAGAVSTFIHAKLMIVDDQFLTVGSANWTNRSMRIDSELNVSVDASDDRSPELRDDIRRIRASLLAEHAGREDCEAFEDLSGLMDLLDQCARDASSKLQLMQMENPDDDDALLIALFDPSGDLSVDVLSEALKEEVDQRSGLLKKVLKKAGERLGVIDTD